MEIDFNDPNDRDLDLTVVPDGFYYCRVVDVREAISEENKTWWDVEFVIEQDKFIGRHITERLHFRPSLIREAKRVLGRLGVPTTGKVNITREMLLGRSCWIPINVASCGSSNSGWTRYSMLDFDDDVTRDWLDAT